MEAHLQGLQGKPMSSNLVCKTTRYRGTTLLSKKTTHSNAEENMLPSKNVLRDPVYNPINP
jgi:hypothetical protein